MKPPCEIVVKQVLPTIRSMLVKDLVERHNLNQVEVAKRLGITQPAVSQYLRSLRGAGRMESLLKKSGTGRSLKELSDTIASGKIRASQIIKMYCSICRTMTKEEIICALHTKSAPYLKDEKCRICLG